MSELSVLSMQYDKLAALSDRINNSVIAVKKKRLLSETYAGNKYKTLKLSGEDWTEASNVLKSFINNILNLIEKNLLDADFIPNIIADEYKEILRKDLDMSDLKNLENNIEKEIILSNDDIQLLDKLLAILDNKRTVLFKKLRTARG